MIISENATEIKQKVSYEMGRGVTVFKSDQGYGKRGTDAEDKKIL